MNKSLVRILICVLCLTALCVYFAGCEKQAVKEEMPKAAPKAEKAPVEKPKAAETKAKEVKPVATEKPKAPPAPVAPSTPATGPGPYKFSSNWMDEQGFISQWLIVGPFPNPGERPDNAGFNIDYLKDYGGELNYTPANGMEVKKPDGTVVKWQQYVSSAPEIDFFSVEFLKLEPSQEDILCYAACWLDCDAEKEVDLRIGSDDGYKLWVNHKEVGVVHEYRSMEMDQETYKVKLNKGKNLILLKVDQDYGEFQFEMRVVNAEGKEVPGITIWN
jgi:hypothetical protein